MKKLLVATRNQGKFLEIKKALKSLPFDILSLNEIKTIPQNFSVKETGESFLENAILKAKKYGEMTGLIITLADDSGLEVEVLGGRPGVFSSRFGKNDNDRNQKLLKELKNVPRSKRDAQFRCLMAIFDPITKKIETSEGVCLGKISHQPKGKHGFGFDPIFFLPQLRKTMAQITTKQKNALSHRGKALKKARKILARFL